MKIKLPKSFISIICLLGFILLRLFKATYRLKLSPGSLKNLEEARKLHPLQSLILVIWHENAMSIYFSEKNKIYRSVAVLVSLSQDGDFAAGLLKLMGHEALRGSSSRGGNEARKALLAALQTGFPIGLTVDGPRGPRRVCKAGAIDMARKSGAPIVPLYCLASKAKIFKSWDRFQLPLPFTSLKLGIGKPILVSSDCEGEAFIAIQHKIEDGLLEVEKSLI